MKNLLTATLLQAPLAFVICFGLFSWGITSCIAEIALGFCLIILFREGETYRKAFNDDMKAKLNKEQK